MHRVHCKQEPFDVLIDRTTVFGNPFRVGADGTLQDVLVMYEAHVRASPDILRKLPEIAGRTLGCWCFEDKACHGDVLINLCEELGFWKPR